MVNFRFHVISLVAVFLALAIGISLGSGFIGETALRGLESNIDDVRVQNRSVRAENAELRAQLESDEGFAAGARSLLIEGALLGAEVVIVRFDHTDTVVTDGIIAAVQEADGSVASVVTINDKMRLSNDEEVAELADLVATTEVERTSVRDEAAEHFGGLMGQAALQPPGSTEFGARARVREFTQRLQDAGYLGLQQEDSDEEVPSEALFVIVGGGSARPGFNTWRFAINFSAGLLDRGATVAVAERSESGWNLVQRVRDDEVVSGSVVTVDHADTTAGQAALVLGLVRAAQGVTGHYGRDEGASSALPEASSD